MPSPSPAGPGTERVFTPPLVVFLLGLALLLGGAAWARLPAPSPAAALRDLADGVLDAAGRERALRAVLTGALGAAEEASGRADRHLLRAGLLAAVALGEREAFASLRRRLDGMAVRPDSDRNEDLALGDPVLANVERALRAEEVGDEEAARTSWRRVKTQGEFVAAPFATELAERALAAPRDH